MSEKIKPHHLERKAILYVRQSSAYQVIYNEESRRLQYAIRERLNQLYESPKPSRCKQTVMRREP